MGRGLAHKHHQLRRRKQRKRQLYRSVWHETAPHVMSWFRKPRVPHISDRFVGIRANTSVGGHDLRCRCDWCKPLYNKTLVRHIDSHGSLGDNVYVHSDPYHGF